MFAQQLVYILGILNLILASIAIYCVTQAEDHPEYFSLVYIAVSIFIFYMGTILIIIILQIIEACQEQHQQNQSLLEIQTPLLTTQFPLSSNPINDKNITKTTTKSKICLPRSQTLPLTLSSFNPRHTISIPASSSSVIKEFNNTISEITAATTHLTLLPKYQQAFFNMHKDYHSFTFITTDHSSPL